MPQFRLTKKFASDCKIKLLTLPEETVHHLDDWFIDRMIVKRRKIAIITHAKSTFSFFIPYAEAGGAKKVISYFQQHLKAFFQRYSLPSYVSEVDNLFAEPAVFTKTVDRKILGHMNDFKYCAMPYHDNDLPIDWRVIEDRINYMPINAGFSHATFPIMQLEKLLNIDLKTDNLVMSFLTDSSVTKIQFKLFQGS